MNQAVYFTNNQYHPRILDRVFHQIHEKSWDYCIQTQRSSCRHHMIGGDMNEFTCDEELNQKLGLAKGTYTLFTKLRIIKSNSKYAIARFYRRKEPITLLEILKNNQFKQMYIFHLAEYLFMALQMLPTEKGTYLIIPTDSTGITAEQVEFMRSNYGSAYVFNRWSLEIRPKTSYGYMRGTILRNLANRRFYLSDSTQRGAVIDPAQDLGDWKIAISDVISQPNLLKTSFADLKFDETDGRPYLEISEPFYEHIQSITNNVDVFAYNEGHKTGFAISPNYIGPTQYLKDVFDEILASVNGNRFKVLMQKPEGGWTSVNGTDTKFGSNVTDMAVVGYTSEACWLAVPSTSGVSPIYEGNFRVWEYDTENDCLNRVVETEMEALFPNLYQYKMISDMPMLYIEWFRDDESIGEEYDDFTEDYRSFIGEDFYKKLIAKELPDVFNDYLPLRSYMDSNEFIKCILLDSAHDYRRLKMIEMLQDTGLYYDYLYDAIDAENISHTTCVLDMAKQPNLYTAIQNDQPLTIIRSNAVNRPVLCYVDGKLEPNIVVGQSKKNETVLIPKTNVTASSIIILDIFDHVDQCHCQVRATTGEDFEQCCIDRDNFPVGKIAGCDLIVTETNGNRVDSAELRFGIRVAESLVQIPISIINWDELGIDKDDPRLSQKLGTNPNSDFSAITFRNYYIPDDTTYVFNIIDRYGIFLATVDAYLLGSLDDDRFFINGVTKYLKDSLDRCLLTLQSYHLMVDGEGANFTKKIPVGNIAVQVRDYNGDDTYLDVYNCNILRSAHTNDITADPVMEIDQYYGSDRTNRLAIFVNGVLQSTENVDVTMPAQVGESLIATFNDKETYQSGDTGDLIHLPFNVDRFEVDSDEHSQINLAGTGVMCIGIHDMIFENGLRINNDKFTKYTNQIVKAPNPSSHYTIIRLHRDSNFYEFADTDEQSFLDKLYKEAPEFKASKGIY